MRNIAEPLVEVENIINHNMEIIHKLVEISNTNFKGDSKKQEVLINAMSTIWFYLKPVHLWIRDQNPAHKEFYDELDKYLEMQANRSLEIKDLMPITPKAKRKKK